MFDRLTSNFPFSFFPNPLLFQIARPPHIRLLTAKNFTLASRVGLAFVSPLYECFVIDFAFFQEEGSSLFTVHPSFLSYTSCGLVTLLHLFDMSHFFYPLIERSRSSLPSLPLTVPLELIILTRGLEAVC